MKKLFYHVFVVTGFTVLMLAFYGSMFDSVLVSVKHQTQELEDSLVEIEFRDSVEENNQALERIESKTATEETESVHKITGPILKDPKTFVSVSLLNKTDMEFMKRMKHRMDERKARVKENCKQLGLHHNWKSMRQSLISSSEYKAVMCQIPKTGITMWKQLFADLKEIDFSGQGYVTRYFSKYQISGAERDKRLNDPDWLKMTVVREPLERLVSAYRSKIEPPTDPGLAKLAKQIQEMYADKTDPDYEERTIPTFSTFVNFLVTESPMISYRYDQHWATFSKLCQFCDFEYDFIGHQETVQEDSEYFLRLVGAPKRFSLPHGRQNKTDHDMAYSYYSTVKPIDRVMKLYKLYEEDYILFGYPRPSWFDRLFSEKQNDS